MALDRITAAEVFVRIAGHGSMTAAAGALDMSRAMVTRYLAQMEAWAGTRLLHRTTRRLSLTAAGEETLARCRRMLDVAAEVASAMPQEDAPRGTLRISCSQSLAQQVLASAVAAYLQRHPQVAVDVQADNRVVNLVEERIDLAVRVTGVLDPNLVARRLGQCASVVCAAPSYLAAHGTPRRVEDLALHNCLTYTYFGRSLWRFTGPGEAGGPAQEQAVAVGGNFTASESLVLQAAAVEGAGITLQPLFTTAPLIAAGRLVALLPRWRPQTLGVHGVYASRHQMTPALRAMLDLLALRFADPAHWPG